MQAKDLIEQYEEKLAVLKALPPELEMGVSLSLSEFYRVESKQQLAELVKAILKLNPGARAEKDSDDRDYNVQIFNPDRQRIAYVYGNKRAVCKVISEREEEYEELVPDPDFEVPKIIVKRTRTVKEWDCGESLMENAQ